MKSAVLFSALIILSTAVVQGAKLHSLCGEDDWILYGEGKCVKLFRNYLPRHEAEEQCNQQLSDASIPTLVTIRSADEQQFLVEYISNASQFNNVWIGAERRSESINEFGWGDGSSVDRYTNWGEGYPTDDVRRTCVQLRSELTRSVSDMAWNDVACGGVNWFICEKLQSWTMGHLQQVLLATRKELEDANDQIKILEDNPVPIGFIYAQLPNQPVPSAIWARMTWTDVTPQYAGLFFRAEGQQSDQFGTVQDSSAPRITSISTIYRTSYLYSINVPLNGQSSAVSSGSNTGVFGHWGLAFTASNMENRPRNTAIRIWKRTG